ncbi:MAG: uroporphyrinogen-III C-methyltransferase [Gemmobacter sp.]
MQATTPSAHDLPTPGVVTFVGAGPGDPDHLTLRAARMIGAAEVVIHDRLIGPGVLDLIPATAQRIAAGKEGFGPSTPQADINAAMIGAARSGARVVRLKSGDAGIFGRLEEETDALDAAGIEWRIVPGLTAAAAAAAAIGRSLTRRGRNGALTLLTGHDAEGFAEQDWRALARPGAVAAVYMGKRAARFVQGRLMMHGAAPDMAVTLVENASRADERILATTLARLPAAAACLDGPAIMLCGLAPHETAARLPELRKTLP